MRRSDSPEDRFEILDITPLDAVDIMHWMKESEEKLDPTIAIILAMCAYEPLTDILNMHAATSVIHTHSENVVVTKRVTPGKSYCCEFPPALWRRAEENRFRVKLKMSDLKRSEGGYEEFFLDDRGAPITAEDVFREVERVLETEIVISCGLRGYN